MSANTYSVPGDRPSNEELARRIQSGDKKAEETLIVNNAGYLRQLARKISSSGETDDLIQEGALALLKAARRFDLSHGTKLLTYATPVIEAAMFDCSAQQSSFSIPPGRYNQLRKVARICDESEYKSEDHLIRTVCEKLKVSERVAAALLKQYRTVFHTQQLDSDSFDDPSLTVSSRNAPVDHAERLEPLYRKMAAILNPRELNLVRYHLGLNQPNGQKMTFRELAIKLNYNSPSGAEKAYKRAIEKLKAALRSGGQK